MKFGVHGRFLGQRKGKVRRCYSWRTRKAFGMHMSGLDNQKAYCSVLVGEQDNAREAR